MSLGTMLAETRLIRKEADLLTDQPGFILKPGLIRASDTVKAALVRNESVEDHNYNSIIQQVRLSLVRQATQFDGYTSVLIPGNDAAGGASLFCSVVPDGGKLAVIANSDYRNRIIATAHYFKVPVAVIEHNGFGLSRIEQLRIMLQCDPAITHVAVMLCTTDTAQSYFLEDVSVLVKAQGKVLVVEAENDFVDLNVDAGLMDIDFILSSTDKVAAGAPAFDVLVAKTARMQELQEIARTSSHALYEQWKCLEANNGNWRFPYKVGVLHAFDRLLKEHSAMSDRHQVRHLANDQMLIKEMWKLGFRILPEEKGSFGITLFSNPVHQDFSFKNFANELSIHGVVISPGESPDITGFHFGNISDLGAEDISQLITAVAESMYWLEGEIVNGALVVNHDAMIASQTMSEIGWIP